jgi:hypothetical protein
MKTDIYLCSYFAQCFLELKLFRKTVVEKIKTHFMFNNFFLRLYLYDIMWKSSVEPDRPQMTIGRMRIACWILRLQTHTQNV